MPPFLKLDQSIIFRRVSICGLGIFLLLLTYVLSIGPAYAYLINHFGNVSEHTSERITSFYSPIYYPCRADKPFFYQFNEYIMFWTKRL